MTKLTEEMTVRGPVRHVWDKPLPGQGSLAVCKKCGCRRTPNNEANVVCDGFEARSDHQTDYDPYEVM